MVGIQNGRDVEAGDGNAFIGMRQGAKRKPGRPRRLGEAWVGRRTFSGAPGAACCKVKYREVGL